MKDECKFDRHGKDGRHGRRAGNTANATPEHVPKKAGRKREFAKKPAEARAEKAT
jgi:hypothetical protein